MTDKQKIRLEPQIETEIRAADEPKGWQYNRTLALGILVFAVLFGILFGVNKGVRTQYHKLTEAYADGVDQSGYGLQYYEQRMEEHASNICKIAGKSKYNSAFQTQVQTVKLVLEQNSNANGPKEKYSVLQELVDAVDALNLEMADADLDHGDEELRLAEYQNFTDQFYKARNIAVDYNEMVRNYNSEVLGTFPANALQGLLHLPEAEEFS